MIFVMFFLQGCSFNFNKKTNTNNNNNQNQTIKTTKEIDYVKEISKNENTNNASECNIYVDRVNTEIEQYKKRVSKTTTGASEEFKLIGIFKSKTLNKCFYVLEDSYTNNNNKMVDYIINNAQAEETIDIFNNVDYKFLNERIGELQK